MHVSGQGRRAGLALVLALVCLATQACQQERMPINRIVEGQPTVGKALIRTYGCSSCHTIPHVPGPRGVVGPPLSRFAKRSFIGGRIPNEPSNLVRWIEDAPRMIPETGMPDMGVETVEAQHIAAFLYTLE